MITNEVTDFLFVPLSNLMSSKIWELFLETKLYIVPFLIALVMCCADALSAGADEGSPAIQAYRKFEVRCIAMFFIMLFAAQPVSFTGKQSYRDMELVTYSCLPVGLGVGLSLEQMNVSPHVTLREAANPTLWHGLTNMFATGITNAAVSVIPCDKQAENGALHEAFRNTTIALPNDSDTDYLIEQYRAQCLTPAYQRMIDISQRTDSYDALFQDKTFFGSGVQAVMGTTNFEEFKDELVAKVKSKTYSGNNSIFSYIPTKEVSCMVLGEDIMNKLQDDVLKGSNAKDFAIVNSTITNLSEGEKLINNANLIFHNSAYAKETLERMTGLGFEDSNRDFWTGTGQVIARTVGTFSNYFNYATDSVKIVQYQAMLPIGVSLFKLVVIIAMPLALFMTGYRAAFLFVCTIGYIAMDFTKFWVELGVYLDVAINSLIRDQTTFSYGQHIPVNDVGHLQSIVRLAGQIVNYGLPTIWMVIVGWMGVKMFGSMQMIEDTANQGKQMAAALAQSAGKALSGQASKYFKGKK